MTEDALSIFYDSLFDDTNAFEEFLAGPTFKDTQEWRDLFLRSDRLRLIYCRVCRDRKEVREEIESDIYLYRYCLLVKDRPSIRNKIKSDMWRYSYCAGVQDRRSIWSKIRSSEWACRYCINVADRPEVRRRITEPKWLWEYRLVRGTMAYGAQKKIHT